MTKAEKVHVAIISVATAVKFEYDKMCGLNTDGQWKGFVNIPMLNLAVRPGWLVSEKYIKNGTARQWTLSYRGQVVLVTEGKTPRDFIKAAPWLWVDVVAERV